MPDMIPVVKATAKNIMSVKLFNSMFICLPARLLKEGSKIQARIMARIRAAQAMRVDSPKNCDRS